MTTKVGIIRSIWQFAGMTCLLFFSFSCTTHSILLYSGEPKQKAESVVIKRGTASVSNGEQILEQRGSSKITLRLTSVEECNTWIEEIDGISVTNFLRENNDRTTIDEYGLVPGFHGFKFMTTATGKSIKRFVGDQFGGFISSSIADRVWIDIGFTNTYDLKLAVPLWISFEMNAGEVYEVNTDVAHDHVEITISKNGKSVVARISNDVQFSNKEND